MYMICISTPPKINMEPKKLVVWKRFSFSKGVFSGSTLVFWGVTRIANTCFEERKVGH